ncbi:glycosyltransferase [Flavobacterium sp. GT2N3]|uniref:glycosyltransferase n=1 Tax=unclassified Flavobacterium TaxID=196869 RepID=UPI003AAD4703
MRILLIGEYSRLHNSLKEGLLQLGHEVVIVADSDGFKDFPVDHSIDYKFSKTKIINIPRQVIARLFHYDIAKLEKGIRFYLLLKKVKNFDIVQFINETPIKTNKNFELFLLKKVFETTKKVFVLSCGVDYLNMKFDLENKSKKSILQPFFQDPSLTKEYHSLFAYLKENHKKLHTFVLEKCSGIIATDFDYVAAISQNPKYSGFIPYPINHNKLLFQELSIESKIVIFLGINEWSYNQKGISYFEKALEIIKIKYEKKVEIIITKTLAYDLYIDSYNKAHILLDQSFSCDQGYNALEAMAKGKVVFTGAEKEFVQHYNLSERVAVNALPDVDYLVMELSFLIEHPEEIIAIGKRARAFVEKEHDYIKIATQYLETWNKA